MCPDGKMWDDGFPDQSLFIPGNPSKSQRVPMCQCPGIKSVLALWPLASAPGSCLWMVSIEGGGYYCVRCMSRGEGGEWGWLAALTLLSSEICGICREPVIMHGLHGIWGRKHHTLSRTHQVEMCRSVLNLSAEHFCLQEWGIHLFIHSTSVDCPAGFPGGVLGSADRAGNQTELCLHWASMLEKGHRQANKEDNFA